MSSIVVNSERSLQLALGELRSQYAAHRYVKQTLKTGQSRSLDQNAISHAWYEQLAVELREDDAIGWKCYCKLHHGVPIMRAEDDDFRECYDRTLKALAYEQKLSVMKFFPVTSLMSKQQLSKYLEAIQADFRSKDVLLEFPEVA